MSLPTFSELMASLNLSNTGEPESGAEPSAHSESGPSSPPSSLSSTPLSPTASNQHLPSPVDSPSIIVSKPDHSQPSQSPRLTKAHVSRSLGRTNRFSPYLGTPTNVHIRRSSLPEDMIEAGKQSVPERASSVSPQMHSNTLRDVSMNAIQPSRPRHRKVMHIDVDATPGVPISSFVRRHTPQSSPTAPTFHHRKRSGSFSPVLLPTLLPGLPSPHYAMEAAQPPVDDVDMQLSQFPDSPRLRKGLRISSYRVASHPHDNKAVSAYSIF